MCGGGVSECRGCTAEGVEWLRSGSCHDGEMEHVGALIEVCVGESALKDMRIIICARGVGG